VIPKKETTTIKKCFLIALFLFPPKISGGAAASSGYSGSSSGDIYNPERRIYSSLVCKNNFPPREILPAILGKKWKQLFGIGNS